MRTLTKTAPFVLIFAKFLDSTIEFILGKRGDEESGFVMVMQNRLPSENLQYC